MQNITGFLDRIRMLKFVLVLDECNYISTDICCFNDLVYLFCKIHNKIIFM